MAKRGVTVGPYGATTTDSTFAVDAAADAAAPAAGSSSAGRCGRCGVYHLAVRSVHGDVWTPPIRLTQVHVAPETVEKAEFTAIAGLASVDDDRGVIGAAIRTLKRSGGSCACADETAAATAMDMSIESNSRLAMQRFRMCGSPRPSNARKPSGNRHGFPGCDPPSPTAHYVRGSGGQGVASV